jgi:hypothetical protein
MPYLYTASPIAAKRVQNPAFTRKGLDGMTSGRLEQIQHVGLAVEKQVAYDGYITNLPAFLHATAVQAKVSTAKGWYLAKLDMAKLIPLPLPPLAISARSAFPNEEAKNKFKLSLGEAVEEVRAPRGMSFVIRSPTPSILSALPYSTLDPNTASTPDATSLLGMKSFVLTLKIISLFLSTHTYPYKQTPADRGENYGRDTAFAWPVDKIFYSHALELRGCATGSTSKSEAMSASGIEGVDFDFADEYSTSGQNAVFVAKPAPLRPDVGYGEPSSTPNFPGYIMPYFSGLVEPSKQTIIHVVRRYFLGCIADSREKSTDAWYDWCRGVDKWYQTGSGKAVAHILFNIQTALESQARVFLYLRNSEYLGCSILGYGSGIMVDGKFVTPETVESLRHLAGNLDDHSASLVKIVTKINGIRRANSLMEMTESEFTKARALYRFISEAPPVPADEMAELTDWLGKLSFEDRLWSMAVNNLTRALDLLACDDPVAELPMYLDPTLIYNTSRAHQVLAAFGPLAPSFVEAIGTDHAIPRGPLADDPASTMDPISKKRPLESIYVSLKKLPIAVGDWTNLVKKRRIRQNAEKRDAGFRTIGFHGEMRDQIWSSLKKLPYSEPGEKRKRTDDDDGEGAEERMAKKGKAKETSSEFTYDDFF